MKLLFLLVLLAPALFAGPIINLANKKGNSFSGELLSATETAVTVRRSSDKKVFSIPLSSLDDATVEKVKELRENLEPIYPEYAAEVSVGKRRKKAGYYMVKQNITGKAKITNKDHTQPSPELTGRILFIGQEQRIPDKFKVLATRDFKAAPAPGKSVELEVRPFSTSYDSDNEGKGNVGGYQYDGYIILLYKQDNSVAHYHTTNSRYRKALESDVGLLDKFRTIKQGTVLSKTLQAFGLKTTQGGDIIRTGS